jgi:hypothetical protein
MVATGRRLHPTQIFDGKAGAYPSKGLPLRGLQQKGKPSTRVTGVKVCGIH